MEQGRATALRGVRDHHCAGRRHPRATNHIDLNVSPLDQMFVVWTAVNRVSRGGEVIGPDIKVVETIKEGKTIYVAP